MSYDPTCKKWRRRYETNIDTRPLTYHLDREVYEDDEAVEAAEGDPWGEYRRSDDRWVPLEYEVEAEHQGGGTRKRGWRGRGDVPTENWMWIAEYGGEQQIDSEAEDCPISIGTSNPSSPGWRRTCERAAMFIIRENLSYPHLMGEPDSLYRFHKSRDKELRIRPVGAWECVE